MTASVPDHRLSTALISSIREGTFPDSEEVLTADLPTTTLPLVLREVSEARQKLEDEICGISRESAADVDPWIVQAKQLHEEIAKSRAIARDVVKEHEASKALAEAAEDARAKLTLLDQEITYNTKLTKALEDLQRFDNDLQSLHDKLSKSDTLGAAKQWENIHTQLDSLQDHNGKRIMLNQAADAYRACLSQAEALLDRMFVFGKDSHGSWVHITQTLDEPYRVTTDEVLEAFERLGALDVATKAIWKNFDRTILQRSVSKGLDKYAVSVGVDNTRLNLSNAQEEKTVGKVLDSLVIALEFLQSTLPRSIEASVANAIVPDLISAFIAEWLSPSVPLELTDIPALEALQARVSNWAKKLSTSGWPGSQGLLMWVESAPKMWLARRRMVSLDRVRTALTMDRGPTRQVERIERQVVSKEDAVFAKDVEGSDWNTGWNDDESAVQPADRQPEETQPEETQPEETQPEEDDVSAWDFDADEEPDQHRTPGQGAIVSEEQDDDSADAWGWDEDRPTKTPDTTSPTSNVNVKRVPRNGTNGNVPQEREVTLKESYAITDIPDHVLDIMSKDVQDAAEVKHPKYAALKGISPSSGLLALPTFVLAMFRATAPSYYTSQLPNGNMHLYNDCLYIAEKLRDASSAPELANILSDCDSLEKFGKSAYSREMDVQRTILADLRDGAQGFTSCTQFPYSKQCEDAVSSVVDRIRQVYAEWSPILSHSALLQSVGSLLSRVIDKMVQDIEDMEDITEPESQRLASFCTQISDLGELLVPANHSSTEGDVVPLTAVYVSNWLRFQYLANILESSLVDIKYLWTEGELSLEFSAEEVVDLIRALFAESPNRRNAIADIRRSKSRQSR